MDVLYQEEGKVANPNFRVEKRKNKELKRKMDELDQQMIIIKDEVKRKEEEMAIMREKNKIYKDGEMADSQLEYIFRKIEQVRYVLVVEQNLLRQKIDDIVSKSQMINNGSNKNINT